MSLLVSDAIDKVQRKINSVGQEASDSDIRSYLQDAVDYFYQNYDLPTAKKVTDIILYPWVREYSLSTDFVSPIPLRKAGGVIKSPVFLMTKERDIYRDVSQGTLAIEFDRDTPYLVAVDEQNSPMILSDCESTTGVTISGDGSDLRVDNRQFINGSASLQFLVSPSTGSTTLTFALSSTFDISANETTIRGFMNLFVPRTNTTALTNVKLRIGNDANNYYEWTKTTRYRGQTITGGWGFLGAYFEQLALLTEDGETITTEDGSTLLLEGDVDLTAIDWVQVVITHGTASTAGGTYRIDSIFLSRGNAYELPYYSNLVIENSAGSLINKITSTSNDDTILLPLKADGAVIYKTLELLAAERWQESGLASYYARELAPYENDLRAEYPRQIAVRASSWMKPSK